MPHSDPTPLIPEATLQEAVRLMGRSISDDLRGRDVTVLPILTGALFFSVDLIRGMRGIDPHVEGIHAKSYTDQTSGELKLAQMPSLRDVEGRHCLIVDDILDTGQTLARVAQAVRELRPASIRVAVLLRKRGMQDAAHGVQPDYVGFDIPNAFVVGYGLDLNARYRNLPYIGVLAADGSPGAPSDDWRQVVGAR